MITRIRINGFKSFIDTELYFGPFTCIAGANAIGKSNFFDALIFLSNLADNTILHAAKSVRSENQKHSNISDIFYKSGSDFLDKMLFEIDMLVPQSTFDDLGQVAEATITSLRYILELKLNDEASDKEPIEIVREELLPIIQRQAKKSIYFSHHEKWLASILHGRRSTSIPFISTENTKIKLHQDGGKGNKKKGRSTEFIAEKMPRTLLSTVTAESPTAFLARQEMRNWMILQFEPSSLRQPNFIYEVKNAEVSANGLNLPATLYRLSNTKKGIDLYQQIANKLKGLVEDIDEISVDRDDKRDLLTLQVGFKDGLTLQAQSLSDGTLRFLGIAIIEEDNLSSGLICLEEPENGINPKKVNKMVELLTNMATDTFFPIGDDNPLRQVIINTHSPKVVSAVTADTLYLAKEKEVYLESFGRKVKCTSFSALQQTWKTNNKLSDQTTIGEISGYLDTDKYESTPHASPRQRTVGEHVCQLKLGL